MSEELVTEVIRQPTTRGTVSAADWGRLLRPRQWTKNLVVFAGLLFTGSFRHPDAVGEAGLAFVIFCLLSSTGYLLNDVIDAEQDRRHPVKSTRPIAAGRIRPATAVIVAILLASSALVDALLLDRIFALIALAYLAVTLTYTLYWKHQVILDLLAITAGFLLRAVAGAVVLHVEISPWLLVCVSLLALLLGLGKRRFELALLADDAHHHRPVLADYSRPFLDQAMTIVASSAAVTYAVYAISSRTAVNHPALVLTAPLVFYCVLRYIYLVFHHEQGGQPEEMLLSDRPLYIAILLWGTMVIGIFIWF